MIYYATIDTNILVSYFISKNSNPGEIINLVLDNTIVPLIHDGIIKEYDDVLFRNEFPFDPNDVTALLEQFKEKAVRLDPTPTDEYFKDLDDVIFYEITLTGRSMYDAYLVTGNDKDFPKKHFVVRPREMLEIIKKDKDSNLQ